MPFINTTFATLHALFTYARAVAEYRTRMGAPWVTEVILFEDVELGEWVVMRNNLGANPQQAYKGSDLDAALRAYGETVRYVQEVRAAVWAL